MKRLLRIFFIVACLAGVAYNLFHLTCPPAGQLIAHWEKIKKLGETNDTERTLSF